jgi:translation initiation factor 1
MSRDGSRLVYSSERGRVCPDCGQPTTGCKCRRKPRGRGPETPTPPDPRDGVVRVRRETKGRKGKTVTTVSGVPLSEAGLRDLAAELKRRCGSGGGAKGGVIEIQGDHCDALLEELGARGYRAKRAGG